MSNIIICVENLSKVYHLGQIGTGTLANDLKVWWAQRRGKPNPLLRIGETDHGNRDGEDLWALREVSFTVEQGGVLGIIGRNGAGKSTLLKILSRVTAPTSGRIKIKGRIARLLEVGTGFHPDLTGRENVYLNGAILGMTRDEVQRKFDEIVAFSEIEKFIDTPVKRYSSGMYVRLAFAVAAHLEPEILIVDEVLAVGDAEFQRKCLGKMREVSVQEGRTVLFVSHQMTAIQQLTKKCILLSRGRIDCLGETRDVVRKYLETSHHESIDSAVDLSHWTPREGDGNARLLRLEILDTRGQPAQSVPMLGGIKFRLTCHFQKKCDAIFGILIHSTTEEPLLDLRNSDTLLTRQEYCGNVVVEAFIKTMNLYPGEYLLSPWISDSNSRVNLDYIRYCIRITVQPAVFEDKILKLDPAWGKFYAESEWKTAS